MGEVEARTAREDFFQLENGGVQGITTVASEDVANRLPIHAQL